MKNPYKAGEWVHGREFYGRSQIITDLLDGNSQCMCLIGNRRIGKTSLLRQIEDYSWENPALLALFIDLSPLNADLEEIGCEILRQVRRSIRRHTQAKLRMQPALVQLVEKPPTHLQDLVDALADIADAHQSKVLLLFDESERLLSFHDPKDPEKIKELDRLAGALRCRSSVRTILTASKRITRLNEYQQGNTIPPFLHEFTMSFLPPLMEPEAQSLICQNQNVDECGDPLPVVVESETLTEILNLTGRHPYWIQFLCNRLFEAPASLRTIQASDLVADLIHLDFFRMDFFSLNYYEQLILIGLARSHLATVQQIYQQVHKQGMTYHHFLSTMVDLERLGLVRLAGEEYLLGNYFLQSWLADEPVQPVWEESIKVPEPDGEKTRRKKKKRKSFFAYPGYLGQFVLDLLGRKPKESTSIILGYILLLLGLFVLWGVVDLQTLVDGFRKLLGFFLPVK